MNTYCSNGGSAMKMGTYSKTTLIIQLRQTTKVSKRRTQGFVNISNKRKEGRKGNKNTRETTKKDENSFHILAST
jgi:hypothetical protein